LNPLGQRAEIRDALQFVVGQFDMKMIFDPRQKVERLEAVNSERLEKIIVSGKLCPWHREMLRRQSQNLFSGLL